MKFEARKYQQDTVDALWEASQKPCHPVIAVPTGAGKTVIMGLFIKRYLNTYPNNKVTVLSHTQDIISQDHDALARIFPKKTIGLYSAGLGAKYIHQVTVAGIQSIYRKPELFKWTNLFIIDEAHTINHKNVGMYRSLLDDHPAMKVGMSATVFRSGHGYIYEGEALFDTLAYDLTSIENFNKLVSDGYLTNLISISTKLQLNTRGVKKSAGDYNIKALGTKFDRDKITAQAVLEVIKYGKNYKKWLIFAIDTKHADNICAELIKGGIDAEVLHSKMSANREFITRGFKSGSIRCLISVGMVTTGFDAPNVDLIVLLRPTMSSALHVQMVGRGLRVADGKSHCLVLDFSGNTTRLGPINDVKIPNKKGKGTGEAPTKVCPECNVINYASARKCSICGYEFPFKIKLSAEASKAEIIRKNREKREAKIEWRNVSNVRYQLYKKSGNPNSVLVLYECGLSLVKEWVHSNRDGWLKRKADHWAYYRGYIGSVITAESLVQAAAHLKVPKRIKVDYNDKYPNIVGFEF